MISLIWGINMSKVKSFEELTYEMKTFQTQELNNQIKALRQYIQMIKKTALLEVAPSFHEEILSEVVKICDSALMASMPLEVR